MSPQQILAEHLQKIYEVRNESAKEGVKNNLSAFHELESESHKPNMREKNKREGNNLVMIATKSEMREVRRNPEQVFKHTCVQRHIAFS